MNFQSKNSGSNKSYICKTTQKVDGSEQLSCSKVKTSNPPPKKSESQETQMVATGHCKHRECIIADEISVDQLTANDILTQNLTVDGNTTLNIVTANDITTTVLETTDLIVNGLTNLNEISANGICLNDQLLPPPCDQAIAEGCLWVADPNAGIVEPPLVTTISENSLHYQDSSCRDSIIQTTPTDPFHGWWAGILKGKSDFFPINTTVNTSNKTIFIDTTKSPIVITTYAGPLDTPRENHPTETGPVVYFKRLDSITLWVENNDPTVFDLITLRLQPDNNTLAGYGYISELSQGGTSGYIFKRINKPLIRPFGPKEYSFPGINSYADCSNPVFMFDEFCNFQLTEQPFSTIAMGYVQYPGLAKFRNHQQILKTTGINYLTSIVKVQRTVVNAGVPRVSLNTQPSLSRFLTVFYTSTPHRVNQFTKVTLSGFNHPILNGTFQVVNYENVLFIDDDPNFVNSSTLQYRFAVELNTSSLAADSFGYINGIGNGVANVQIGPVTPITEYRELMAIQTEMFYFAFKYSTHSAIRYYTASTDPFYCIDTFANLQTRLRSGTAVARGARLRNYSCGSIFYNNLATIGESFPNTWNAPINNPFGMIPTLSSNLFAYSIPLENYLDFSVGNEPRNIWWRMTGPATTPLQQLLGLTYYGNLAVGQTFEAITWPAKAGVPPPPGAGVVYRQLGGVAFNNWNSIVSQRYVFGRINPALVGGQNIGYIRMSVNEWADPFFGMLQKQFAPAPPSFPIDTKINNPRANYEATFRVLSEGLKYIVTTLGCSTRIILDVRGGVGGGPWSISTLASFFGGDRKNLEFTSPTIDTGFSSLINIGTYDIYDDAMNKAFGPFFQHLPSKNNLYYPGSVLNSSGARVYILNDMAASSSNDTLPHMFLGDLLNKNIGSGVTAKIFGDINGVSAGATGSQQNMTTSAISFPVTVNTTFTGSISGNVLTITTAPVNGPVAISQLVTGINVLPNTYIINFLTGTGRTGTYLVSVSQTSASSAMSIQNVPVPFNRFTFENCAPGLRKMRAEPKSLLFRVPELEPDAPLPDVNFLGPGPWPNAWEDNAYPDIGAPGAAFPVPRLPGDARLGPNLLPQWPAQPTLTDRALWRDRWLEQTVWDAIQP